MAEKAKKDNRPTKPAPAKRNFFQKVAAFFVTAGKKLKTFFVNLRAELKRVVWPDRKRLIQSTATVLAICVIVGVLLFVIDTVLSGTLDALGFYSPKVTTTATTTAATTATTTATTAESGTSATTAQAG
ncbi:MAG: preprotein translocase subunit SecE [Clostridiales bacterium]|nr:preprotein translocase subunit SecE [Clostridiales bacterium]